MTGPGPARLAPGLACWLVASCSALAAHAQQPLADGYASVPLQRGAMLSLWGSEPQAPGSYALGLGLQARSLTRSDPADPAGDAEGSATRLELLTALGIWRDLDLSAAIALERTSLRSAGAADATEEQTQAALGDARVIPRFRLLSGEQQSGVSVLLPVWIPTGTDSLYQGEGVRVEPRVAASLGFAPWIMTVNAGYLLHPAADRLGVGATNFFTGGLGAELQIAEAWSVLSEVSARWSPDDRRFTSAAGLASDAHLAARYSSSGWAAQFGAGTGLAGAALEPDWRLLASVSFSPVSEEPAATLAPPVVVAEPTRDDYPNESPDWQPPTEPEAPELASEPPANPATRTASASSGAPPSAEPPPQASDDVEGSRRAAGDELPALPRIKEVLQFAPNQMRLTQAQRRLLDDVAMQLMMAPPDAHLLVEGHSDSAGPRAFNWKLSRMRASTVRYHLLQRGIDWRRVSIRGYGASRPALRKQEPGNPGADRRVEFRLIRLGASD